MAYLLLWTQNRMMTELSDAKSQLVKDKSWETIVETMEVETEITCELASNIMDGYIYQINRNFVQIVAQVEDIFENPELYGEREVSFPECKDVDDYTVQLIYADENAANDEEGNRMIRKIALLSPTLKEFIDWSMGYVNGCYISLPSGITLAVDKTPNKKFDENGRIRPYDVRTRPWYEEAIRDEFGMHYSMVDHSFYGEVPELQFGMPVYVDGRVAAVVHGTMELKTMQKFLYDLNMDNISVTVVVNEKGQIIFSSQSQGELGVDHGDYYNVDAIENSELKDFLNTAIKEQVGSGYTSIDGSEYYGIYTPVVMDQGWVMVFFVSEDDLQLPVNMLLDEMDALETGTKEKYSRHYLEHQILIAAMIVLLAVLTFIAAGILSKKLSDPISLMTDRVKEMTGERFVFKKEDAYRTGDEIEVLADTFGSLSDKMDDYMKEILAFTAEKERVGAEMEVAKKIQEGMLPSDFPLFPGRHDFTFYASMKPAKEVGGDFYDAYMIDDDHLCMVEGDVSGKGVPAALFMVRAMTIIKNRAMMGGRPSEILRDVNDSLCERNEEMMFVTVWLGILTLSTGVLTEANAGHECPAVRTGTGDYSIIDLPHSLVLGTQSGMDYDEDSVTLRKGDTFFVYTDGLTDATNKADEMFDIERVISSLNEFKEDGPKELLEDMSRKVSNFVGDGEQFDDLTMLAIRYDVNGAD
ncbi:MAG: SpoIIE family protein phosphatase [Butyrivibrio sp.]|nr:SpoIIE family protein phosphatase [Butyrivibrio sp.]